VQTLGSLIEAQLQKKQRGARRSDAGRVALI
jgi:hypothetical protein